MNAARCSCPSLRFISILLAFICILFTTGCFYVTGVRQDWTVEPGGVFDVEIDVDFGTGNDDLYTPYLLVQLPEGWSILSDSIQTTGDFRSSFVRSSRFDVAELPAWEVEEGFQRVGFVATEPVPLDSAGVATFSLRITTDGRTGMFRLNYLFGAFDSMSIADGYVEGTWRVPVSIGMPSTVEVTSPADDGPGSLRQALEAVACGGQVHFNLASTDTIDLDSALIVDSPVSLIGPVDRHVVLNGGQQTRIMNIYQGMTFSAENVDFVNSYPDVDNFYEGGGAIQFTSYRWMQLPAGGPTTESTQGICRLKNCRFSDNTNQGPGGAVYAENVQLTVSSCVFRNNRSLDSEGGAVYIRNPFWESNGYLFPTVMFDRCEFSSTQPDYSTVCGNTRAMVFTHCSFSISSGYEIWADGSGPLLFLNSIARGDYIGSNDSILVMNSDIVGGLSEGCIDGGGNIFDDPQFVDPEHGDLHLSATSPCIDAGTPFFVWEGDTLLDLQPDQYAGSAPDIGCYENGTVTTPERAGPSPSTFSLSPAWPNPFNPSTTLHLALPVATNVRLEAFNLLGRRVALLADGFYTAGIHPFTFDGSNLAGGVYFLRAGMAGQTTQVQKVLLLH